MIQEFFVTSRWPVELRQRYEEVHSFSRPSHRVSWRTRGRRRFYDTGLRRPVGCRTSSRGRRHHHSLRGGPARKPRLVGKVSSTWNCFNWNVVFRGQITLVIAYEILSFWSLLVLRLSPKEQNFVNALYVNRRSDHFRQRCKSVVWKETTG